MVWQYLPQTNEKCYSVLQWLMWLFLSLFPSSKHSLGVVRSCRCARVGTLENEMDRVVVDYTNKLIKARAPSNMKEKKKLSSLSRTHSMSLRCWPYSQLGTKSSCIVAYIISLGWDGRARAVAAERQIKTAYLIQQRRTTTWGWKFAFYGALGLTQTHPKQDVFPS